MILRGILLWLSLLVPAHAATIYPCDITPKPVMCYGTAKLASAYSGNALTVQKLTTTASTAIGFNGDHLNLSSLYTFLSGQSYGRVMSVFDQSGNGKTASCPIASSICSPQGPKIEASLTGRVIGNDPALLFEGGSNSGAVFGLDLPTTLFSFGIGANKYSVVMVVRPTASMFRNQNFTPGLGKGTFLSLDYGSPVSITGDTTAGSAVISNVSSTTGIAANMIVTTGTTGPFPNGSVVVSVDSGADTITLFDLAATNTTAGALVASAPMTQIYANGGDNPGSPAMTDRLAFTLEPSDTMLEAQPVVLAFTCGTRDGARIYQNEVIRTAGSCSARAAAAARGYIGRMAGSQAGGLSQSGDFWMVALLIYNVELTAAERASVSAALYQRFRIDQRRSRPSAGNLLGAGDSIEAAYEARPGLYGMLALVGDQLAAAGKKVRVGQYGVPGSQVTASIGTPTYGYTEGMFANSIASSLIYSRTKNVLFVLGGGNDMVNTSAQAATMTIASPAVVTSVAHGMEAGRRLRFDTTGALPTPLNASTIYYVKTVLSPDTFTIAATPTGAAIDTSGSQSGTHTLNIYTKTAASIYAGIESVVTQAAAAASAASVPLTIKVGTVLPRYGAEYDYILDDLNTLIRAGVGAYSLVDFYTDSCLATRPGPTGGPCYFDSGHPNNTGHAAAATIIYNAVESQFNFLLKRDLDPAANDNSPMWLKEAA